MELVFQLENSLGEEAVFNMSTSEFMRVFWPSNLRYHTTPGLMVGWRNSELDIFVVSIIDNMDVCGSGFITGLQWTDIF